MDGIAWSPAILLCPTPSQGERCQGHHQPGGGQALSSREAARCAQHGLVYFCPARPLSSLLLLIKSNTLPTGNAPFLIKTAKGRNYMLKGDETNDVDNWLQMLRRAIRPAVSPGACASPAPRPSSPEIQHPPKFSSKMLKKQQRREPIGFFVSNNATATNTAVSTTTTKPGPKRRYLYKRYLNHNKCDCPILVMGSLDTPFSVTTFFVVSFLPFDRRRVFGVHLEELLQKEQTQLGIPIVVHRIIQHIERASQVEGIFRLSGGAEAVRQLKKIIDNSKDTWSIPFPDEPSTGPHVVASLLKLFMKELPEPLVPNEYYEPFLTRQKVAWPTYTSRLRGLRELLFEMPTSHRAMLSALADLLRRIAKESHINQMTPKNLAICLAPNIFRPNDLDLFKSMSDAPYILSIMKTLIIQQPFLFAEVPTDLLNIVLVFKFSSGEFLFSLSLQDENPILINPERKSSAPILVPISHFHKSLDPEKIQLPSGGHTSDLPPTTSLPKSKASIPSPPKDEEDKSASASRELCLSEIGIKDSKNGAITLLPVEESAQLLLMVDQFLYEEGLWDQPGSKQLTMKELLEAVQKLIDS